MRHGEPITALPQTPPAIRGVINLRGRVVPVIDMTARFGRGQTETVIELPKGGYAPVFIIILLWFVIGAAASAALAVGTSSPSRASETAWRAIARTSW